MNKAVITILGTIDHDKDKAEYKISKKLGSFSINEDKKYINMLTVLSDITEESIIAIGTKKAIEIQKKVIKYEKIKRNIIYKEIDNEQKYDAILLLINSIIDEYDEVIFDVSHGFRHLPILATISLIIEDIKNPDKINNILYAKELVRFKKYEIIDLKEYLELAKLSYVLSSFNENYTIGNSMTFSNESYQYLTDNLGIISKHILANSVQQLLGDDSRLNETIESLNELKKQEDTLKTFGKYIEEITIHLNKIKDLKNEPQYYQFFQLALMMRKRGYLLNAITLFNESVGLYCAEELKKIDIKVKNHIEKYQKGDNNLYELTQQSKNIIKNGKKFNGVYLFDPMHPKLTAGEKTTLQNKKKKLKEKIPQNILKEIENSGFVVSLTQQNAKKDRTITEIIQAYLQEHDTNELEEIIVEIETLRNNLAHGNSSNKIANVPQEFLSPIKKFSSLIKVK